MENTVGNLKHFQMSTLIEIKLKLQQLKSAK